MYRGVRGLLLIDDQAAQAGLITAMATRASWRVVRAIDPATALTIARARRSRLDAILFDSCSPRDTIVAAVSNLRQQCPDIPVVVITAQDSAALAIEAIRAGASDFIVKPITPDRLFAALDHATSKDRDGELRPLTEKSCEPLTFGEIVGDAPCFRHVIDTAARVAATPAPVLIEGESGVGKEVIAQAIHRASPVRDRPLVTVNCGAIPANLVESELFGHERGAFTGAFDRRIGHFASADGGTIFLDEIGELPLEAQVKLLRVLQSGEIQPIGARAPRRVSVRILAATNRSLAADVAGGRFREDLYYRLAVVQIVVPPLRNRTEDIAPLAQNMLARIAVQLGTPTIAIDAEALDLLAAFDWPGNVRQLHNVLFRAAIFCRDGRLGVEDFPHLARASSSVSGSAPRECEPAGPGPRGAVPLFQPDGHVRRLDDIERDMMRLAIAHYQGRMTEVARRLGIGRSTLYRRLGELGIDQPLHRHS